MQEEVEQKTIALSVRTARMTATANAYVNERAVGRGIKDSGVPREEVFLSTKLWPSEYENENAVDETLERLGVDYVDLLYIHQPAGNWQVGYKQLEKAYKEGKAKSIGICNFEGKYMDPYVWGGSSPETSFDCSGFVSWVINHCGNGWNVGRLGAEGLRQICAIIPPSEAKPGDLIFFQGTYNTTGASHVAIYCGNGMMIHCGNPIQYANINNAYWQEHFYCFGRLN